jgi:hypothetical protein
VHRLPFPAALVAAAVDSALPGLGPLVFRIKQTPRLVVLRLGRNQMLIRGFFRRYPISTVEHPVVCAAAVAGYGRRKRT